jgi:DNA-directed RNA polymerase subunit RPC12/RpoP
MNVLNRSRLTIILVGSLLLLFVVSLFLLALGLGIEFWPRQHAAEEEEAPRTKVFQQYRHTFTTASQDRPEMERTGPGSEMCVKFEPEGLRITLPVGYDGPFGWDKERPDTGLSIPMAIKGDFEITVSYEILKEPASPDAGYPQTRFSLDVAVDREHHVEVMHSRRISKWAGPQFLAWVRRFENGKDSPKFKEFPAQSPRGWLRVVRTGATVAFYAADGPDGLFTLLQRYPFSSEPVESIRISGSTGGPKAALDVRVTELTVRGESLKITDDSALPVAIGSGGAAIVLVLALVFAVVLGVLLAVRRRRRSAPKAAPSLPVEPAKLDSATEPFSFLCSHCGKKLKARAELSGKHVRCPECGKAVHVMAGPV